MARDHHAATEDAIRRTGARVTVPRVQILAMLLAEGAALTHQQVETRVNKAHGIDRVTIYRVLEWLVRNGLAHRIEAGVVRIGDSAVAEGGSRCTSGEFGDPH